MQRSNSNQVVNELNIIRGESETSSNESIKIATEKREFEVEDLEENTVDRREDSQMVKNISFTILKPTPLKIIEMEPLGIDFVPNNRKLEIKSVKKMLKKRNSCMPHLQFEGQVGENVTS